jgi:hypothetical protein
VLALQLNALHPALGDEDAAGSAQQQQLAASVLDSLGEALGDDLAAADRIVRSLGIVRGDDGVGKERHPAGGEPIGAGLTREHGAEAGVPGAGIEELGQRGS